MKQILTTISALALFILCSSSGCKHDASVTPGNTNTNPVTITSGDWLVSYFNDGSMDMTAHLAGYHFDFKTGGVLTVATNGHANDGTWTVITDSGKQKFIIAIPNADAMLEELNEDWTIIITTATEIDLKHDSGHPMEVHFTK